MNSTEYVIARLHPHARVLFWPAILFLAVSGGLGFGAGRLPEEWQNLGLLALGGLIVLVGCVAPLLRWAAHSYTITTQRTVLRSGILRRVRREVRHDRAIDLAVHKGVLQTLFGSGDIVITVSPDYDVELRDVPSVDLVATVLDELMEATELDRSIG